MKKLFLLALLSTVSLFAQTPPQFVGLLTTSTDYTCGAASTYPTCSTWPMPANPGMGNSYTDPLWGTTTWELNVPTGNTGGHVASIYSRVQGFSENNDYLLMDETDSEYVDLYNATTTPPTPINRITTTDGSWISPGSGDANWANTVDTRIYYIGGFQLTGALQLRYVDVSACTSSNCVLTPTVVHTFSCISDKYYPGADIAGFSVGTAGTNLVNIQTTYASNLTATTLGTAVTSTGSQTVTPGSMVNISTVNELLIDYGTANQEIVTPTAVTATTFTATFTKTHISSAAVNIAVIPYSLSVGTYLNGVTFFVLTSGLTSSQATLYSPSFTHANVGLTTDNGIAGLAGVPGNQIETGSGAQGGMGDATDAYYSFACDNSNGGGRAEIDVIRYNKSTDTVTTQQKWYTVGGQTQPTNFGVWGGPYSQAQGKEGYNMLRMNQHPSQGFIEFLWQCGANLNSDWSIGCGIEYYSPTYTLLGPVDGYNGHNDHGYDINGYPTWVGATASTGAYQGAFSVAIANLNDLSPSGIVATKEIYLPCPYAYQGTPCSSQITPLSYKYEHVSMTGTWGSLPGYMLWSTYVQAGPQSGYALDYPPSTTLGTAVTSAGSHTVTPGSMAQIGVGTVQAIDTGGGNAEAVTVTAVTGSTFTATFANTHTSTAPVQNMSTGDTGPLAMEMLAVKIDTTVSTGSTASYWRIGRAMSIRDDCYDAEPHASANRNFTALVWGSTWNVDPNCGSGDGAYVNGYYIQLTGGSSTTNTVMQGMSMQGVTIQ